MKRTPWLGNGEGHVYEHVMTPPEPRTWTWRDCPSFILVTHPENAPADPQKGRPIKARKGLSRTTYLDGRPRESKRARAARILAEQCDDLLRGLKGFDAARTEAGVAAAVINAERAARILAENAPMVQRDRGE